MENSRYTGFLSDIRKIDSTCTQEDTVETMHAVSRAICRRRHTVHDLMLSALSAAAAVTLLLTFSGLLPHDAGRSGSGHTGRHTASWPSAENSITESVEQHDNRIAYRTEGKVPQIYAAYMRNIRIRQHMTENRKNF